MHEIMGRRLHAADEFAELFPVLQDEVDFVKADDGPFRQVDRKALFFENGRPTKWKGFISSW